MAVEAPATNRAGNDWRAALNKIAQQPIDLQRLELEPQVVIDFDQTSVLINEAIAIGVSERAAINVIAAPADRLPAAPQLLFTWLPQPDPRVVNLTDRGRLDLGVTDAGLMIYTDR
jgi:hypothetical protein